MELNGTLVKIQELLAERDWSLYKLAKSSCIPYSSLNSLFHKNHQPTVSTLEKICEGFHITMSEFFAENTPFRAETYDITKEELELVHTIRRLNKRERRLLSGFIKLLREK